MEGFPRTSSKPRDVTSAMTAAAHELLIEIRRIGAWRRVAVLDPATGREAVVHGPAHAAERDLVRLARRRLQADAPAASPAPKPTRPPTDRLA